jgi:hypothetical protein
LPGISFEFSAQDGECMKVVEKNFENLFKNGRVFVIPAFQRGYAWKTINFEQLWGDLEQVLAAARARHFMGTVVFEPDDTRLSVVDGQQRLITFSIILRVLMDLAANYAPDRAANIRQKIFISKKPRVIASLHDRSSFDLLLESPKALKKSAHPAIFECYGFFYAKISTYIESTKGQRPAIFNKICEVVLRSMIFVELELTDQDDTHAIFETINYAGVPLTAADLARNLVLGRAKRDEDQRRLYEEYWLPLEKALIDRISGNSVSRRSELSKVLPEFLRSVLIVEKGKYIGTSDLFRELRVYFRQGKVEDQLRKVCGYMQYYQYILRPADLELTRSKKKLSHLLDLKMTTYNPLLLVLFRAELSDTLLERAIQCIESFIVRRSFNSRVSRDLPKVFARISSDLANEEGTGRQVLSRLQELLEREKWPSDDEFRAHFLSTAIYTTARETARFVLLGLERDASTSDELALDKTIQIEHVFPQSAKLTDWDEKSIPALKRQLHVIGNLTLAAGSSNVKYSNRGFDEKKVHYKKSPYYLTKTLKDYGEWTSLSVEGRAKKLFRRAVKLWPGPKQE